MLWLLVICGARLTKPTKKGKRALDVPHVDVLESWFGAEVGTRLHIVIVLYCSNPSCTTYCSASNPAMAMAPMADSLHRNVLAPRVPLSPPLKR